MTSFLEIDKIILVNFFFNAAFYPQWFSPNCGSFGFYREPDVIETPWTLTADEKKEKLFVLNSDVFESESETQTLKRLDAEGICPSSFSDGV